MTAAMAAAMTAVITGSLSHTLQSSDQTYSVVILSSWMRDFSPLNNLVSSLVSSAKSPEHYLFDR